MPAQIDPFHAIAIGKLAYELAAAGQSIIHMEYGQPSTGAPAAAIAVAHAVLDADPMGYWENPALKERIARLYREQHGVEIAPERIILTCGASPALVLALNLRGETALQESATVATPEKVARGAYLALAGNCATCHTPNNWDPHGGETVDLKVMIHKIHAGGELPTVHGPDGNPCATADNGMYAIWGNSNTKHEWWKVGFPAVIEKLRK